MATRKRHDARSKPSRTEPASEKPTELRLIANLLGLLAVRGESKPKQMITLSAAGFSAIEVATLLRTTPNAVSVALYRERRSQGERE
jgi:hypothetical protein